MPNWLHEALYSAEINTTTATFRLLLSLFIGGLVGLERRWKQQPAGFRTHILICLGATLLTMLSIYIPQRYVSAPKGDPGRIAAQILTGIGFLGAGAIIKIGSNIRGLTTAAAIWMSSAIGMAIGAGLYEVACVAAFLMLFILIVLERFERRVIPDYTTKTLTVVVDRSVNSGTILAILKKYPLTVINVDVRYDFTNNSKEMNFMLSMHANLPVDDVIEHIGQVESVRMVNFM